MPRLNSYWMSEKVYNLVTKKTPIPCVDLVILREIKETLEVLLILRKTGYARGNWCLIGGRQRIGETLKDALKRQAEELGIEVEIMVPFTSNFPAWIYDELGQDKTKQSLTHIYPVRIKSGQLREEGKEYESFKWFPIAKLPKLAFDQNFEIQKTLGQLEKFKKI